MSTLASVALRTGLSAVSALLERGDHRALLARLEAIPGLSLARGTGRDSAHFFLNFLRHAQRRGWSAAERAERAERHLLRPIALSEKARLLARARDGSPGLRSLILSTTVQCNLRCEHCYNLYEIHHEANDHLSVATMERVIGEAKALGAYRVSVIGGEPLLRWRALVALAQTHADVLFTVFTNGHLLTDEVARALVERGNVELAVSVDGPAPLHDAWRGEGSYALATAAIERYCAHGGMAMFAPTVTRENMRALLSDAFIEAMIERGAYMGYLHHYDLVGGQERADWLLEGDDLRWLRARIDEVHRAHPLSVLSNVVSDLMRGGCPAVRDFVHVNHRGQVEPCCMVPFAADSVHEKSLREILRSPFFERIREAPSDAQQIKRCLVGDNLVTLRRATDTGEARGTTRNAEALFAHDQPGLREALPTCFSLPRGAS